MRVFQLAIITSVLIVASAAIGIPPQVHYRGFLTDLDGVPVHCPDTIECNGGPYTMVLSLYPVKEAGEALWTQSYTQVSLRDGVFDLTLGDEPEGSSLYEALALTDALYLGVSINGGAELLPRQRLAASAWAILASDAKRLGGVEAQSYALAEDLAPVALSGDYNDLVNAPDPDSTTDQPSGGGAIIVTTELFVFANTTKYLTPDQTFSPQDKARAQMPAPRSGTLANLFVVPNVAPSDGCIVTVTLLVNGEETGLSVTHTHTDTTHAVGNTTESAHVNPGDLFAVQVRETGGVTSNANYRASFEFK